MEAGETPSGGLGAELDRIEAAVDAGDADLRRLGFWRVVALIKRDDELIERHAEQVGRIDTKAFRARVRWRAPVWVGNAVLLALGAAGAVIAALAFAWSASRPRPLLTGVGLLAAAGCWAVAVHSPTHWVIGRIYGIRFTDYFLGGPPPPRPGLKIDYATYLRAAPEHRAAMHASGAILTKLAPFLPILYAPFLPNATVPDWARIALLTLAGVMIVTDILFSTKTGDWSKVRRELRIGWERTRRAAGL